MDEMNQFRETIGILDGPVALRRKIARRLFGATPKPGRRSHRAHAWRLG